MLIGISGRKGSGKSTISQLLIERGFKRASFATSLKEYLSKIYGWELGSLDSQEGKEGLLQAAVFWDKDECKALSDLIGAKLQFEEKQTFYRRREALQYIGTEVLRKFDSDFHVKEFKKRYADGDFVCDDLRFPNELKTFNEMNAICVYVLRPGFWEYSNHYSEIALSWYDFEYVLLNNSTLPKLISKCRAFFDNLLLNSDNQPFTRRELISVLEKSNWDTLLASRCLNCTRDNIIRWARKLMICLNSSRYELNHGVFAEINQNSAYWAGVIFANGVIKQNSTILSLSSVDIEMIEGFREFLETNKPIYLCKDKSDRDGHTRKDLYVLSVSSPFLINDLKLWNIEPIKSRHNKIPDIISSNEEMLCFWLVGLIDGDRFIYKDETGKIRMGFMASLEIVDFISNWLNIPSYKWQVKDVDNLWRLEFFGENSMSLYKRIYRGIGLKRKWNKFNDIENN